jgi:riboflavin biosynthesis pyrimidine reductase
MEPIRTLFATESSRRDADELSRRDATEPSPRELTLPDSLRAAYDGDLYFPAAPDGRPYLVANFVSTLDGVVSFNLPGQSGGDRISGSNEGDRFIMGLLRASVDAVMVGSATVQAAGPNALWLPEFVYPPAKDLYRNYRQEVLKKTAHPLVVIVSGSGRLDLSSAVFHTPGARVLIVTTEQGRQRLAQSGSEALASVDVRAPSTAEGRVAPSAILKLLRDEFGVGLILHEGGPTLFGDFLASGFVDELFLTIAPQIAGRIPAHPRPSLTTNVEFFPATAPWWKLLSAKKAGDHLYLHYQLKGSA